MAFWDTSQAQVSRIDRNAECSPLILHFISSYVLLELWLFYKLMVHKNIPMPLLSLSSQPLRLCSPFPVSSVRVNCFFLYRWYLCCNIFSYSYLPFWTKNSKYKDNVLFIVFPMVLFYALLFVTFFPSYLVLLLFFAVPRSLWDLSSPTRSWTWATAVKVPSPNPWTTREFPFHGVLQV